MAWWNDLFQIGKDIVGGIFGEPQSANAPNVLAATVGTSPTLIGTGSSTLPVPAATGVASVGTPIATTPISNGGGFRGGTRLATRLRSLVRLVGFAPAVEMTGIDAVALATILLRPRRRGRGISYADVRRVRRTMNTMRSMNRLLGLGGGRHTHMRRTFRRRRR